MSETTRETAETSVDVGSQRIARVYAESLLSAADKAGKVDSVMETLDSLVVDLFTTKPELEEFLSSRALSRDTKADMIRRVFQDRTDPVFVNFLLVLNDHDRLDLLRVVRRAFREVSNERARRIPVKLESAVPLTADQLENVAQTIRKVLNFEPIIDARVDPDLLGGFIFRLRDWVYDASLRTRLQSIRSHIIARSSHEIQSGRDRFSTANGN